MEVTVRRAYAADAPDVARLIRKLAVYEKMQKECRVNAKKLLKDMYHSHQGRIYCLIARDEKEKPVACAAYYIGKYSTFRNRWCIYLEDIFVEESCRGQGVGRTMLGTIARDALAKKLPEVAFSVLDWNKPSIEMYKKLGAVETGLRVEGGHTWVTMSFMYHKLRTLAKGI